MPTGVTAATAVRSASRETAAGLSGLVERERGGGKDDDGASGVLVPVG